MSGLTTIVIPCYNQAHFIDAAIRSALAQDRVEVIVIDDGSTDECAAAAARHAGVHVLRQPNRGVANARNAGLQAGRGEFVLFLDADDRLLPGAVESLRKALDRAPDAAFAFGRFQAIDDAGAPVRSGVPHRHDGSTYESLLQSNFICAPATVLYRRDAVIAAGGFPKGLDAAADYALYLHLAGRAPAVEVNSVVAEYRLHSTNMSRRADRMLVASLRAHARERAQATTPALRQAWNAGRTHWKQWYGDQLVDQIRAEWRARQFAMLARDVIVLAWHAPRVFYTHTRKKVGLVATGYLTRYTTKRSSS